MRRDKRKALEKSKAIGEIKDKLEQAKAHFRGLAESMERMTMLFALSRLWMIRRHFLRLQG